VKKLFALCIALAVALSGCATFGIEGASSGETREGVDYKLFVRAWDKKATDLGVVFMYRVNGGSWQQKPGIFNGSLYEAVVAGGELQAGYLEYYASMRNAKGETVSSKPTTVKVLSFAEAKTKAEREYLARLSDGATAPEIIYNEPATFKLTAAGATAPSSVRCGITSAAGTRLLSVARDPSGAYSISIAPPHAASYYAYQWTVVWQDPTFGEITSIYPPAPRSVPILDQVAVKARVEREFKTALKTSGTVAGTFFDPPVAQARLDYGPMLEKYSIGPRQVSLMLKRIGFAKQIGMSEIKPGVFSAQIPSADLEQGPVELSYLYSDSFADIGYMQAQYPVGQGIAVAYRGYEDLRREAIATALGKLTHQPPVDGVEGSALTLRLDASDQSLRIVSASLDGVGQFPIGRGLPFVQSGSSWFAAVPGAAVRPGTASYSITARVQDPRFGDLMVRLPASDYYTVLVKSQAQVRDERAQALRKSLFHAVPTDVVQNRAFILTLRKSPSQPNESASLFYRTAESTRYRELRALPSNGTYTFTVDAADTMTNYIRYYFAASVNDPSIGLVTATLRDSSSGAENDFIVTPLKQGPQGTAGAEPPAEPFKPLSFYKGQQADRAGIRFFVEQASELGLYDIVVMVKVQGRDQDFRACSMERKGKEFSFALDTRAIPPGSRVEYYYVVSRKGQAAQQLAESDGKPFIVVIK